MGQFWFTQHWPHPVHGSDDFPWFVYLQRDLRHLGAALAVGDQVLFYETLTARRHLDASGQPVLLHSGRGAVVMAGTISSTIRMRTAPNNVKTYTDGSVIDWAWEVPVNRYVTGRPVGLADLRAILRRQTFRIHGGIMPISHEHFDGVTELLTGQG